MTLNTKMKRVSYIKYFETMVLCHKDEDKRVDRVEPSG